MFLVLIVSNITVAIYFSGTMIYVEKYGRLHTKANLAKFYMQYLSVAAT